MIPREEIVLCHNDLQENNILAAWDETRQLTMIDFEYGEWNPMAYDLANYLNEIMVDNAHV